MVNESHLVPQVQFYLWIYIYFEIDKLYMHILYEILPCRYWILNHNDQTPKEILNDIVCFYGFYIQVYIVNFEKYFCTKRNIFHVNE